ncbi:hypothetical protein [Burkholderia cepacia]|uniref:hypothetical protein n=1 Tax=Burkholderia cepacia TaxID=292 RepID=UPI001CF497A1|nr:hypothetical protein [Burkholderia cepacia]MCA8320631.1 hypothetical protein [Burkholderia cepacia]
MTPPVRGFLFVGVGMAKDTQQRGAVAPVTFIDTEFRSRVIVFPDGSHVAVLAGKTEVTEPAHIAYLESRGCFKRIPTKAQ